MGAARGFKGKTSDDEFDIDHSVGVKLLKSRGDQVKIGEVWAVVHHSSKDLSAAMNDMMEEALVVDATTSDIKNTHVEKIIYQDDFI